MIRMKKLIHVSFEYRYDEFGNWITKKKKKNETLSIVWERKIEYHGI